MIRTFLLSIALVGLLSVVPSSAYAQNSAGVGIKPALIEEMMEAGESRQFSVTISNISGKDQTYYLYRRDIVDASSSGVPQFAPKGQEMTGLELSNWITLETEAVDIPVNAERTVSFVVAAPDNAPPGSHFGGIFISVEPPDLESSGAAVGYEVANIISIRIAGDVAEKANIRQLATNRYVYASPIVDFSVKIENTGSTMVRPTGPLSIRNMFGKEVAALTFNESLGGIFPGTTRDFILQWTDEGTGFGRYEATLTAGYGIAGAHQSMSSTVTFWILPMNIIGPALLVLVVLLLITYFSVKLYIRSKLSAYTNISRRIVRRQQEPPSIFIFVVIAMLMVVALFLILLLVLFA